MMAVSCGTPTPATMRVVQIEPGPMPTLIASAPASISALAPSAVATLPATTCTAFDSRLMRVTASSTAREWPCAVSTTTRSTPASIRRSVRSKPLSPTVVAAATRSRPCSSLQACGLATAFSMSFTVMSPTQRYCVVDHEQLLDAVLMQKPLGFLLADAFAHGDEPLLGHQLGDLLARIGGEAHVAIGENADELAGAAVAARPRPPECRKCRASFIRASASASVASGAMVSGLTTMPDSNFLTWRTCAACCIGLEIAVDDAEPAGLRHGDRHLGFGHGIHGGGDDRDIERDFARDAGADVGVGRQQLGQSRLEQDVVEGERFAQLSVGLWSIANSSLARLAGMLGATGDRNEGQPAAKTAASRATSTARFGLAPVDSTCAGEILAFA